MRQSRNQTLLTTEATEIIEIHAKSNAGYENPWMDANKVQHKSLYRI